MTPCPYCAYDLDGRLVSRCALCKWQDRRESGVPEWVRRAREGRLPTRITGGVKS